METNQIQFTAPVDLQAGSGKQKRPTFSAMVYSGGAIEVGFGSPVIVDLGGVTVNGRMPILMHHDSTRIAGQASDVQVRPDGIYVTGNLTGIESGEASKVIAHARDGFEWQMSIGAKVNARRIVRTGETEEVNGRKVTGPAIVATKTNLHEVSFVASGADQSTLVSISAAKQKQGNKMNFEDYISAAGFEGVELSDAQEQHLRAAYNREYPAPVGEDVRAERERIASIYSSCEKHGVTACQLDDGTRIDNLAAHAIESGMSPREAELVALRASTPKAPSIIHRKNMNVNQTSVLEAGVCLRAGVREDYLLAEFGEQTMHAADRCRSMSLVDVARQSILAGHGSVDGLSNDQILASASSSYSLPSILSNVARRALESAYAETPSTWVPFTATRNVQDFRQVDSIRPNWSLQLEEVGRDGEIHHGGVDEEVVSYQAKQFARMFAVDRKDLINDDLGAFDSVPRELARAAKQTLDNAVYSALIANADSFFGSANGNLMEAGSALSAETLGTAMETMRTRVDAAGNTIDLVPTTLLVPAALESAALVVLRSLELSQSTDGTGTFNPMFQRVGLAVEPRLQNVALHASASETAWFLFSRASDAAVIVAYLNGNKVPRIETSEADFNRLGIQFRCVFDFGVALGDHRAVVKATGAAS